MAPPREEHRNVGLPHRRCPSQPQLPKVLASQCTPTRRYRGAQLAHVIGDYESGQISLATQGGLTEVGVHWPFDRETDEWIDLTAQFSSLKLQNAARVQPQVVLLHEFQGSTISLKILEDGRFRILLKGHNSLGPVEADLIVPNQIGVQLRAALAEG